MSAAITTVPDISDAISRLQENVSASRLNTFSQCRLKFWFRYVLKIQKAKTPSLHFGSVIHGSLKSWNKARWMNQPLSITQLHEEFAKAWADQEDEPVAWDDDEREQQSTAWRLLETYIRESPIKVDQKPDAVEVPVETDLSAHGLPRLVGVIDLIQGGIIIDYKSASATPNPATVGHLNEIQTSAYSVMYRDSTGRTENGIEIHHLVKLKAPKIIVTPLPAMSPQQETRLFRTIESYQHGLDVRDFVPSPGMGCLTCQYLGECRQWCG